MAGPLDEQLTTSRLVQADAHDVHLIQSDARTWRHSPSARPMDITDTEAMIVRSEESWIKHSQGLWVVRADETVVGVAGATMTELGVWNLYYRLSPEFGGRGYASIVAARAVNAARVNAPASPIVARILENNPRSGAVAVRAGLSLQWRGPVGRTSDRLLFADRELSRELIARLSALG